MFLIFLLGYTKTINMEIHSYLNLKIDDTLKPFSELNR